jgi:3'-5' exoribonuclease
MEGILAVGHVLISEMKAGYEVRQFFLLHQKEVKSTRKGDPYWDIILSDRSGSVKGKIWADALPRCEAEVEVGQIVGVQGRVEVYQEELQLGIHFLAGAENIQKRGGDVSELELDLLLPKTPYDIEELWHQVIEAVEREILHEGLKDLVMHLLTKHEQALKTAPAALLYHHSYLGGLLEHSFLLLQSVLAWHDWEKKGNRDLLAAGAILHDIGKIHEIQGLGVYQRTFEGRLLGHLIQGRDLVKNAAQEKNFPDDSLLVELEHIILSHHGQLEFGSPVVPQTREAFIIHALDDLNAKLKMFDDHVEKSGSADGFTEYHKVLKRRLLIP